jgi:hypothetical protein
MRHVRILSVVALAFALFPALISQASAAAVPRFHLDSVSDTAVAPGGELTYHVQVLNLGEHSEGAIRFKATLDPQLRAVSVKDFLQGSGVAPECHAGDGKSPVAGATTVLCETSATFLSELEFQGSSRWELTIVVAAEAGAAGGLESTFETSGGGGSPATTIDYTRVLAGPPAFGIDSADGGFTAGAAGAPASQAGAHPFAASTTFTVNTVSNPAPLVGDVWPVAPIKDVVTDLPPGLVGGTAGIPVCSVVDLGNARNEDSKPLCSPSSQIGTATVIFNGNPAGFPAPYGPVAVYNLGPSAGIPVRFGFNVLGTNVILGARVRTGAGYGVEVAALNASQTLGIPGASVTLWGVPASASHDGERGCGDGAEVLVSGGPTCRSGSPERAILRMPTSCTAEGEGLTTKVLVDSWDEPGAVDGNGEPVEGDSRWKRASFATHEGPGFPYPPEQWGPAVGVTGCEAEPFTPRVSAQPTNASADSPTGLDVAIDMPQEGLTAPEAISQADVRKVVTTLPEGMTVNPAQANGVQACTLAQIALKSDAPPTCPDASKIGSLTITTPLLEEQLKGSVYLAKQSENPFGTLLAIYFVAEGNGVTVKLPGRIDLDPHTGRLKLTVSDAPQLPFSKFEVDMEGGERAPLAEPPSCGPKTIETELTGWNEKVVSHTNIYEVPCTAGLGGFAPAFTAGTDSNAAGTFSPFALSFSRGDGEQKLSGLSFTMPPGVSAVLKGVAQCPAASAVRGTCPVSSRIGSVDVASGVGADPVFLLGTVYLTGAYNGGAFGEVTVVPAVAGPFHLGNVIVRGSIRVDPTTAQPTIVSDAFPQFVGNTGIPSDIRRVDIHLDRSGFSFNPTSCDPEVVAGVLSGTGGAKAAVSNRFQAADCGALSFKPNFTASTQGNGVYNRYGASLDVKIATKQGPSANPSAPAEANIRKVEVALPKILPSRLTTLQKACTEKQFATNPAGCPAASNVGTATASTPLLTSPLSGPAYLVSHGGAAFPDLVLVLQGEGVRVVLTGHTQIKKNVTYSRFETVPDAPISSFELRLPEGRFSALAAVGNLCGETKTTTRTVRRHGRKVKLKTHTRVAANLGMNTTITAQNGTIYRQTTHITPTGCPKARAAKKASKARH